MAGKIQFLQLALSLRNTASEGLESKSLRQLVITCVSSSRLATLVSLPTGEDGDLSVPGNTFFLRADRRALGFKPREEKALALMLRTKF